MAKSSYGCLFVIWSIDESKQMSKIRCVEGEIWGSEKSYVTPQDCRIGGNSEKLFWDGKVEQGRMGKVQWP